MKAQTLMTNNPTDSFCVFVGAKKNFVNQWSCPTLEQARMSIQLFKEQNPDKDRNFAVIKNRGSSKNIEEINLV